jgi:microcystin-dependent protein
MSDPFVAEIRIFGFNFAPRGWAFCDGQLMAISQNTALFSLLGTTYGGDGRSTFALPNLQGSAPMQPGQGPGLSLHDLGETGGEPSVTLLQTEMPIHAHTAQGFPNAGGQAPANNTTWSDANQRGIATYAPSSGGQDVQMSPQALSINGGSLPHNNLMPYLVLNFCISQQGIFPQRP